MFSSQHATIWQSLSNAISAPNDIFECHREHNSGVASLFWVKGIGLGEDLDRQIIDSARHVKARLFDNFVYGIAPVYVSSICAERCAYCNYRAENKGMAIERIRLSDNELAQEVEFLIDRKGLRTVELVYATDPFLRVDAMCRQIEMVKRLLDRHGGGTVGINAEAFDEHDYIQLVNAGLSFAVLWQETYDREKYLALHPGRTKKTSFEYRLDAPERMLAGGVKEIGMGILSGLADWRTDWAMLIHHETYLLQNYGRTASILGIPRLKPAAGAAVQTTPHTPTRQEFLVAVAIHNLFSPSTMAFVNTREDWPLCIDIAHGGGCLFTFNCSTIPGGYSLGHKGYQFPTASYDAPVFSEKLRLNGIKTSFNWPFDSVSSTQLDSGSLARV